MSVRARATQIETEAMERVLSGLDHHSITIADLAFWAGLDRREVEQALERIRHDGLAPLCAGRDGVWLAHDLAEYERHVERRRRRAIRQLVNVRGERKLLRQLRQPMTLGLDA